MLYASVHLEMLNLFLEVLFGAETLLGFSW
jgi:hypothetical protein